MRGRIIILVMTLLCGADLHAWEAGADSSAVRQSDRGVMLNAESASAPRVLNVGLPESTSGAVVFIDGMKAAQGLPRSYFHWAGGNSYRKTGSLTLMESVIRTGEISAPVYSWTRLGEDRFTGVASAQTSSNGLIRFDGWIGGPVGGLKGWYYSAGAYANFDPTSVNSASCTFVERKQIYQATLSRRWKSSELNLMYRYSWCGDQMAGTYNTAPFVYNGDGSVSVFDGFRMGYDRYFPADDLVRYMDLATGEMKESSVSDFNDRRFHDISVLWKSRRESGWDLTASMHLCLMPRYDQVNGSLAGIDSVTVDKGFSLPDGTPFEGYIQQRMLKMERMTTYDAQTLFMAEKNFGRNEINTGLDIGFANQYESASSLIMAHTVEASPLRIYNAGRNAWNLNRNSLYFDALKLTISSFIFDKFQVTDNFSMLTGIRLCPVIMNVHSVARLNDESKNRRIDGFNLADPALANMHMFRRRGLSYAFSESLNWAFAPGFTAVAEGFYSITNKSSTYFRNATIPSLKSIGNAQARAGLQYVGNCMDLRAVLSYITSWNNAANVSVTKQIGGVSETIPWVAEYGIGTKGFTLDGNVYSGGFRCHALFTWQDPRYHNYDNTFTFSDGSTQTINYTGKHCTGISNVMVEVDPSYKWKSYRVWASARYYSRQYASRTNLAYFNGRFETFGGFDWDCRKDCKISLSFVNILGQGGVKGSIDIADTIDDEAELAGYMMAGTFIRPFSVDLSVTYRF